MNAERGERLRRDFFERDTVEVAISLLGAILISVTDDGRASGRIVEVEAYGDAKDLASHASRLKRGGVLSMSGPAGIAYIYRSYGIHAMFNAIAKRPGCTGAVLVRAIEPIEGLALMYSRRPGERDQVIGRGPGNLCAALGISLDQHGTDLVESDRLWIEGGSRPRNIMAGRRIGISRSIELPWRFFDADSVAISAHRQGIRQAPEFGED